MRKFRYGSMVTGRERGVEAAYSGELFNRQWLNIVDGTKPTHTGTQLPLSDSLVGKATHFLPDMASAQRNYVLLPKGHDWRLGGTLALTIRSTRLGASGNKYICAAYGNAVGNTYYQMYLGPANLLSTYFATAVSTGYTMTLNKWVRLVLAWSTSAFWVYVDGAQISTVSGLTFVNDIVAGTHLVGQVDNASNVGEWDIADIMQSSVCWTADEAKNDYNRCAKRVQFQEDFGTAKISQAAETSGFLSNTGWSIGAGSWQVMDDTINGKPVKAVKCTAGSSGQYLYVPLALLNTNTKEGCYGIWEFWLKNNNAFRDMLGICSIPGHKLTPAINAYWFGVNDDNQAIVARSDNGAWGGAIINSATNYISNNVWYKYKVTRNYAGVFKLYVNDLYIGTATDTTYTTGLDYLVLHSDSNQAWFTGISKRFGAIL